MMKYKTEEVFRIGKDNTCININWEMVSHCQYDCSYCYYKPFQSDTNYTTLGKIVLKKLQQIEEDFVINLIGGEPTLHPDFIEILNKLIEIDKLKEIRIVTNLVKPLNFWVKITPSPKVKITASYHPEYPNKSFIEKLESLAKVYRTDTAFLITNEIDHLDKSKEVFKQLFTLSQTSTHTLNPIRLHKKEDSVTRYISYQEEINEFIIHCEQKIKELKNKETVSIETISGEKILTKPEFLNNELHALKGWRCAINAFIIHYDAMVSYACKGIKKHILTCDFKTNAITCPFNYCECDDYWEFRKDKA